MDNDNIYYKKFISTRQSNNDYVSIVNSRIDNTIIGQITPSTGFFSYIKSQVVNFFGGSIWNTKIDMHNKELTNLPDPVNPQDAVNLQTLENYVSTQITQSLETFNKLEISLSGTNNQLILNKLTGSYIIKVWSNEENFPITIFHIVKNNTIHQILGNKLSQITGENNTVLNLTWASNQGIYLNKSTSFCDGIYTIQFI